MVLNPDWQPAKLQEVELSETLPILQATNESGQRYTRAQVLVRLYTIPVGIVELALPDVSLSPDVYAPQIYAQLHEQINHRLLQNGQEEITELPSSGIQQVAEPTVLKERAAFLQNHPPFVSVAIATRDRGDQLHICLASLVKQAYPNYEIILVDNAPSNDETQQLVEQHYGHIPFLRYIREERPGAAWARNRAIQEARGEILAYTDDDVIVDQHWVASIARAFSRDENIGGVSGITLPAEMETEAQELFEQFNTFSIGYEPIVHNIHDQPLDSSLYPFNSMNFAACVNMAYRTAILRELNGFDPALGPGSLAKSGEDTELYLRVVMQGYSIAYEPAALVYHFHRRDYAYLQRQTYDYGVAFTASAIRFVVHNPQHFMQVVKRLPRIIQEMFGNSATRKAQRQTNFPKELHRNEMRGWLYGPIAYWRSRGRVRDTIKRFGKIDLDAPVSA